MSLRKYVGWLGWVMLPYLPVYTLMSMGRKNNGSIPKQIELLVPGIVKLYTERPAWGREGGRLFK